MIKSTAVALLTATVLNAEITINDIDKLVNDIKEERIGLEKKEVATAKDPFIYPGGRYIMSKNVKKRKKRYHFNLTAIINDRVKINRKWYGLNAKVNGYKISKIGEDNVLLVRNNKQVRVFLKRPKSKKIKLLAK
ncbi:hypothetical protein [Hydrogenimonas urashimensis]|uniref:hypothetical protein n=1 Tax=Hydrogenimonas urashimensis TaxID=2740515 RepID=UPI001915585C|nr:hypothetical protein [Hydrogenimonas urashimensis]